MTHDTPAILAPSRALNADAVTARLIDAIQHGDIVAAEAAIADGFVYEDMGTDPTLDKDAFLRFVAALHAAMPDLEVVTENITGGGDAIAVRLILSGTLRAPLDLRFVGLGRIEAAGQQFKLGAQAVTIVVEDGLVVRAVASVARDGGLRGLAALGE